MGILDRFSRVVQASVKDLLDGTEEPERLLDHALREMQRELDDAKERLHASQGGARVAREMAEGRTQEAARFAQQAAKSREDGLEQSAREAEGFRAKAEAAAHKLVEQATAAEGATVELADAVKALESAIQDTRAKQQEIAQQLKNVRQAKGGAAPRVGSSRVAGEEEWRRVPGGPEPAERSPEQVEWELNQLHRRSAVEEKLAELKKKMGGG